MKAFVSKALEKITSSEILGQKIEDNLYQFSDHKINTKGLPKGVYVLVCRTNTEVNNYNHKFTRTEFI